MHFDSGTRYLKGYRKLSQNNGIFNPTLIKVQISPQLLQNENFINSWMYGNVLWRLSINTHSVNTIIIIPKSFGLDLKMFPPLNNTRFRKGRNENYLILFFVGLDLVQSHCNLNFTLPYSLNFQLQGTEHFLMAAIISKSKILIYR